MNNVPPGFLAWGICGPGNNVAIRRSQAAPENVHETNISETPIHMGSDGIIYRL